MLNEDAALRAISTKLPSGQQSLHVGDKGHRINKICKNYGFPHTKGHLSEEFWFKFSEIKAKFQPKKRDSDGDKSVKAISSTASNSYAWCVKSVAYEINSAFKSVSRDKSVVENSIVKKISTTHLYPKKAKNKFGTIMNNSSGLVSVNMSDN